MWEWIRTPEGLLQLISEHHVILTCMPGLEHEPYEDEQQLIEFAPELLKAAKETFNEWVDWSGDYSLPQCLEDLKKVLRDIRDDSLPY